MDGGEARFEMCALQVPVDAQSERFQLLFKLEGTDNGINCVGWAILAILRLILKRYKRDPHFCCRFFLFLFFYFVFSAFPSAGSEGTKNRVP